MISHIALLRGINVGANMLKMERLREIFAELGLDGREDLPAERQCAVQRQGHAGGAVGDDREEGRARQTRLPVSVIIRTPAQLKRVVDANPFLKADGADAKTLHVTFLAGAAPKAGLAALGQARERATIAGRAGQRDLPLLPRRLRAHQAQQRRLERLLGVRATTRNWNTVTALHAMAVELERRLALLPRAAGHGAAMPGSSRPSSHSRKAPPAVET